MKFPAGHATGDSIKGFENIIGSAHADTLIGDDGDNVIEGKSGADTLDGGAGVDTVSYARVTFRPLVAGRRLGGSGHG